MKVMDLDPQAGRFGRSTEVKVKIAAPYQPVPPAASVPGYPPAVGFTDGYDGLIWFWHTSRAGNGVVEAIQSTV
ncbi:MAG: hypothetical protein HKP61_09220 [Dactylosporangium sp.]|nr:hypothetical protein [Dactylosporangium sp.]NNJ61112.1 hypothetical protein [Dactylosporangium sp.]